MVAPPQGVSCGRAHAIAVQGEGFRSGDEERSLADGEDRGTLVRAVAEYALRRGRSGSLVASGEATGGPAESDAESEHLAGSGA